MDLKKNKFYEKYFSQKSKKRKKDFDHEDYDAWAKYPFVRLIIPFILGIIFSVFVPFEQHVYIGALLVLLIVMALIILFEMLFLSYKNIIWVGVIANIVFLFFGYQYTIIKTEKLNTIHFSKFIGASNLIYARLCEPYIEKENTLKCEVEIKSIHKNNGWITTSGKAMITFAKDLKSLNLRYGDELIMQTKLTDIEFSKNPGEFNYKRFLSFHNIYQQGFLGNGNYFLTGNNSGYWLFTQSYLLRDKLLTILSNNNLSGDEFAVGAALLLGYTDKLDADIISAYASTGALHVLSVSGMHVALIVAFFNLILNLFFIEKIKNGKYIKLLLLLSFVWFYSMLTGMSPSVLRAATMCSFVIVGKTFRLHTNIYNILGVSAFFLLLINPFYIMNVGFQLSYIAVIGIVFLQPKIYGFWNAPNRVLNWIWKLTCISIAAQIATFPLGLLYFHQFPTYFLLSNFVVIPISEVIIYTGIVFFIFMKIPLMAKLLGIIFYWAVFILNYSVKILEHLPGALLQGISVSIFETWIIYGLIILFVFFFSQRKIKYLFFALLLTIVVLCSQAYEQYIQRHQKEIVIYNINKTTAIDFISGATNYFYADNNLINNESSMLFHIKHNWWDLGIKNTKVIDCNLCTNSIFVKDNYIQFCDKKIALIKEKDNLKTIKNFEIKKIIVDYLIVSKDSKCRIKNLLKIYEPELIVFDSSTNKNYLASLENECNKLKQKYYSVEESGALIINL